MKRLSLQLFLCVTMLLGLSGGVKAQSLLDYVPAESQMVIMADIAKVCKLGEFAPQEFLSAINWEQIDKAGTVPIFLSLLEDPAQGLRLDRPLCIFSPQSGQTPLILCEVHSSKTLAKFLRRCVQEREGLEYYKKRGVWGCYADSSCILSDGKVLIMASSQEFDLQDYVAILQQSAEPLAEQPIAQRLLAAEGEICALSTSSILLKSGVTISNKEECCSVVSLQSYKGGVKMNLYQEPITAQAKFIAQNEAKMQTPINGALLKYVPKDAEIVVVNGRPREASQLLKGIGGEVQRQTGVSSLAQTEQMLAAFMEAISGDVVIFSKGGRLSLLCQMEDESKAKQIVAFANSEGLEFSPTGMAAMLIPEFKLSLSYKDGVLAISADKGAYELVKQQNGFSADEVKGAINYLMVDFQRVGEALASTLPLQSLAVGGLNVGQFKRATIISRGINSTEVDVEFSDNKTSLYKILKF